MYLTLRQMHYFEAIVTEGSMNRAAARLHVSVTALSLQLKQLEEHTGHKLLIRHPRGVTPTPVGYVFHKRCREILGLVEATEAGFEQKAAELPRFRIGMPPSATRTLGYLFLGSWKPESVGFEFELHEALATEDLISQLKRKDLDAVIGFEIPSLGSLNDRITVIDLLAERLVFVTARGCRRPGAVDLSEAMREPLLIHSENEVCWRLTRRAAQSAGIDFPPPRIIGSIDVILHIVSDGQGAIIAPRSLVEEQVQRGELVPHDIVGNPLSRTMSLAMNADDARIGKEVGLVSQVKRIARGYHRSTDSLVEPSNISGGADQRPQPAAVPS